MLYKRFCFIHVVFLLIDGIISSKHRKTYGYGYRVCTNLYVLASIIWSSIMLMLHKLFQKHEHLFIIFYL